MKQIYFLTIAFCLACQCFAQGLYHEKYRAQFHFSPAAANWLADPSGFLHYKGTYHMFWWGKLTSTDLVHYHEQNELALVGAPSNTVYFTGSAVVDKNNTAGFGSNKMIPVYTFLDPGNSNQDQGLSVSTDTTYTSFQYYSGNPVLTHNDQDFRDPSVFWYAPTSKWIMAIAVSTQKKIQFYSSSDLKTWTYLSDFGPFGAQQGIWEAPDLMQLRVDGSSSNKKWVLVVSMGPDPNESNNPYSKEERFKEQYFMGSFDGTTFTPDAGTTDFISSGTGLEGTTYMNFDGTDFGSWTATGTCFGSGPFHNAAPVHIGSGAVSSFNGDDSKTGTLTSPSFTISHGAINFLIGAGYHPGQTCINLIVNSTVVRSTSGNNSPFLKWRGWDVTDLQGQTAQIQIVDSYTGGDWGHIDLDQIMFADAVHDENREQALYLDYGMDFYASRSFKEFDDTVTTTPSYGWLSNWDYANLVPMIDSGRGIWTVARNLELKTFPEGVRLTQNPVTQLDSLKQPAASFTGRGLCGVSSISEFSPTSNSYEIDATFTTTVANKFGFNLCVGGGRKIVVGYNTRTSAIFIDRSNCTDASIADFSRSVSAPVAPEDNKIRMRIFVDKSSIEVFTNSGKVVFSALTYPDESQTGIEVFADSCNVTSLDFSAWMLNSIWSTGNVTSVSLNNSSISLAAGGPAQTLAATVLPSTANQGVTWISSNNAVATVNGSGEVLPVASGTATITATTKDGNQTATCTVTVTPSVIYDFESGDLGGWSVTSGTTFTNASVTNASTFWTPPQNFNKHGSYHLWGFSPNGDGAVGEIRTANFRLGGSGKITFLIAGGNDINNLYVALVRTSDNTVLMKATGANDEAYTLQTFDGSAYIGTQCYVKVYDNATGGWGHINLDYLAIPVQNYQQTTTLDFETGTLAGWTVTSGNAFSSGDVCTDVNWDWGGPFGQQGSWHLWGYKSGGDGQVGEIRTDQFTLAGSGQITFLMGGGSDINNLYVALCRSSDDAVLMKATGADDEAYSNKTFNAAAYVGVSCYIKVVDNSTGGWGHVNIDNFQIPVPYTGSPLMLDTSQPAFLHFSRPVVYPVPAHDHFIVDLQDVGVGNERAFVQIVNTAGGIVYSATLFCGTMYTLPVQRSMPPGVYLVSIKTTAKNSIHKLVIQ